MAKAKTKFPWQDKVINHQQIGGIETSIIDSGLGRGNRIAWVNTGSGLRYKVVIDRGLDIAGAFFNQYSISWLSHSGFTAPRPDSDRDLEWLTTFGGGLLTTCGLTHIGDPEKDQFGQRGIHGRISNIPAELQSIVQPDLLTGKLEMSITATMKQTSVFGPSLELKRTISSELGEAAIRIKDVVTNVGNATCPHMLLYHCNFGWPLTDKGTQIVWKGKWQSRTSEMDAYIFSKDRDYKKCPPPLDYGKYKGEPCAFVDIDCDSKGICTAGLYNEKLGLAVAMKFKKKQLPWLTNWQHWAKGEYLTGIEPGTNPPIGQAKARKQKTLIFISPGKSRAYDLEISVLTNKKQIKDFLRNAG